MDYLFLLGRILLGGFFVMSGWNHFTKLAMMTGYSQSKGLPAPQLGVLGSGVFLLLGGLSIILGAYVTIGVWLLVIFLIPAALKFHDFWTVADPQQKMMQMLMFMRNIALVGAALMILAIPAPWALSLSL